MVAHSAGEGVEDRWEEEGGETVYSGGGEAAQECWGSLKRIRQCCLVLAVHNRYSRLYCIDCIDSRTAYTTHSDIQYTHCMHILHTLLDRQPWVQGGEPVVDQVSGLQVH
jgi:hypothetical protein